MQHNYDRVFEDCNRANSDESCKISSMPEVYYLDWASFYQFMRHRTIHEYYQKSCRADLRIKASCKIRGKQIKTLASVRNMVRLTIYDGYVLFHSRISNDDDNSKHQRLSERYSIDHEIPRFRK
ncbi:hypothetical protein BDB00DRAFT_939397 [Zychaea mexicana]|uniref:uncharacterized protein n=1 Tax=Zychaea mexicana TaxID=64656 RepID=UPI0022FF3651|nr:uncharacterized protein BDB00DRAFT_939397 [Zychaea mexicana]KAI9492806.1 hypothetical protein BDB00DRAFT_939397 [Zychaea mexicana]